MELKEAKCPNCGGNLKLNPALEKGICVYCGTELLVAEAIQKFQGEVSGIATTQNSLIHAQHLLEDGKFDDALKTYQHIIATEPMNAEAQFGMFRCTYAVAEYYRDIHKRNPNYREEYIQGLQAALNYGRRAARYANDNMRAIYEAEIASCENNIASVLEDIKTNPHQSSSGGCYVATAVYGSYDCPEVWTLRRYRDYTLAESWYGRAFIAIYYAVSPSLVRVFGKTKWFRKLCGYKLDKMVCKLNSQGVENTPYCDRNW